MLGRPTYQTDSYRRRLQSRVVGHGENDRPWVVLEDTIFYPEGGGQPSDRGSISGRDVVDVQWEHGSVRHYLRTPWEPSELSAELELDWGRRFDHMQQHTAQHLLTALAADRFGWQTTSFHLGAERCDIELDVADPPAQGLADLEAASAEAIRASLEVRISWASMSEYEGLRVRSRGLPEGHRGDVRLVAIDGIDLNTCGGTHVSSTSHLEAVKLLGHESIRGGSRLFYVAGGRLRRRMQSHEDRCAAMRLLLGTGDEELVATIEKRLSDVKEGERTIRRLQHELIDAQAALVSSRPESLLTSHFRGKDIAFLQALGRAVVERRPDALVFLTSEQAGNRGVFLLASGESREADLPELGRKVAELLGGRGGGSGGLFQGKAGTLSAREAAVEWILQNIG